MGVVYTAEGNDADTQESLTEKILAVTPTQQMLNAMTVEQLKVLADCLELTYVYSNKANLIALILDQYEEEDTEPTTPTEASEPTEPTESTEATEPTESTEATEPSS